MDVKSAPRPVWHEGEALTHEAAHTAAAERDGRSVLHALVTEDRHSAFVQSHQLTALLTRPSSVALWQAC